MQINGHMDIFGILKVNEMAHALRRTCTKAHTTVFSTSEKKTVFEKKRHKFV